MRKHEYVAQEITDEQVVSLIRKVEKKGENSQIDWSRCSRSFKDKTVKDVYYALNKEKFTYEEKCILVKEFIEFIKFTKKGKDIVI